MRGASGMEASIVTAEDKKSKSTREREMGRRKARSEDFTEPTWKYSTRLH